MHKRPSKKGGGTEARKRGRPATIEPAYHTFLKSLWGDRITTERGLLNKYYEQQAFNVIHTMDRVEFLCNPQSQKIKWGILRELGRFSEEDVRALAVQICEDAKSETRTVREWASILRLTRRSLLSETVSENRDVEIPNKGTVEDR